MDPNETRDQIRELVADLLANSDDSEVWRLAELVDALDVWLSGGGFLPEAWARRDA